MEKQKSDTELKKCNTCKENKLLKEFYKNKSTNDGLQYTCKQCLKDYSEKYNKNCDKDHKNKLFKEWHNKNLKDRQLYHKEYRKNNSQKEYESEYRKTDKFKEWSKGYRRLRFQQKKENDVEWNIIRLLRSRLTNSILNKSNKGKTKILLSCTIIYFKTYIETKFLPEMNWENWGKVWELDHIIPCSSFNLFEIEEQQKCFHYSNFQPLFKTTKIAESFGYTDQIGNRNKYNKIIKNE